jgi:hypothetical protein
VILGCLTFTSSRSLFFRDVKTLDFWTKNGQMAVFQDSIPSLPKGSPVIYLGEISQKVIRTKPATSVDVLDDGTITPSNDSVETEYPVARVFTKFGLGLVLLIKLKAFEDAT